MAAFCNPSALPTITDQELRSDCTGLSRTGPAWRIRKCRPRFLICVQYQLYCCLVQLFSYFGTFQHRIPISSENWTAFGSHFLSFLLAGCAGYWKPLPSFTDRGVLQIESPNFQTLGFFIDRGLTLALF